MSIKPGIIISFILILSILTGCRAAGTDPNSDATSGKGSSYSCSRDIFAMDTYMTITCYGENASSAADAAEAEIKRLDSLLSVGDSESEISILNRTSSAQLSNDSCVMIDKALALYESTDGAFDITIYPVMELWGFTSHDHHVPDESELRDVLEKVGSDKLSFSGDKIILSQGQGVDLGGIAKGYASDRLAAIFEEYGLESALISLGGNVHLYGAKPDGSLWRCGIRDPLNPDSPESVLGVLNAKDCAVITSGGYERYFISDDGTTYHHIIDPHTGFPAESGIISSTIVSESGMLADALSTAVYVMGLEKASDFWRNSQEEFEMILMTGDGEVYVTEGLEGSFSSSYPTHFIRN